MSNVAALTGGFSTPATDAAAAFRGVMNAMARPGTLETLTGGSGPAPLSPAAATVLLTLADATTPVFLGAAHDTEDMRTWLAFHTGAPIAGRSGAQFALGTWGDLAPLAEFSMGTPEYPDRSVTLIVECDTLSASGSTLRGPGIESEAHLSLPETEAFQTNHARFPLGFDTFFTAGDLVAGLPRSTEVS